MSVTPKRSWPWVKTLLRSVYDQPDADAVHAQYDRVLQALQVKLPAVMEHLETARPDLLASTAFPREIWRQIWSDNPQVISSPRGTVVYVHHAPFGVRIARGGGGYLRPVHDGLSRRFDVGATGCPGA